jgi:thioesterase domain-containing protein
MTLRSIEKMIHQKIPLTRQMHIKVSHCSVKKVTLKMPLKPNRNHLGTGFGGSVLAGQALCCWAFLMNYYEEKGWNVSIVLQDSQARFIKPVIKDFFVECRAPRLAELRQLDLSLERHCKGRIELKAYAARGAVEFSGRYVIVRKD